MHGDEASGGGVLIDHQKRVGATGIDVAMIIKIATLKFRANQRLAFPGPFNSAQVSSQ
jgi:hypothetical protein